MIVRDRLSVRKMEYFLVCLTETLAQKYNCASLTQNVLTAACGAAESQTRLGGQLHQRYLEFSVDPERGSELPQQQD